MNEQSDEQPVFSRRRSQAEVRVIPVTQVVRMFLAGLTMAGISLGAVVNWGLSAKIREEIEIHNRDAESHGAILRTVVRSSDLSAAVRDVQTTQQQIAVQLAAMREQLARMEERERFRSNVSGRR